MIVPRPLCILTAFGAEYQTLWKLLESPKEVHTKKQHGFASVEGQFHGRPTLLVVTGMGDQACRLALSNIQVPPDADVLLTGFVGSVVEDLTVGEVFVPEKVVDEWGTELAVNEISALPKKGNLLFVKEPVLDSEKKRQLAYDFIADAVDMESLTVVHWARDQGHRLLIVKTVMDDLTTMDYSREGLKDGLRKASVQLTKVLEEASPFMVEV